MYELLRMWLKFALPRLGQAQFQISMQWCMLQVDVTSARRSGIAWHPDGGSLLAVPGVENDVSMFERLSWNVAFSLKGPHSAAVNLVSFSPNGEVQMKQAACSLIELQHPHC